MAITRTFAAALAVLGAVPGPGGGLGAWGEVRRGGRGGHGQIVEGEQARPPGVVVGRGVQGSDRGRVAVQLDDVENTAKLIAAFARRLEPGLDLKR